MGSSGDGSGYQPQINAALQQANTPKSGLAQNYSQLSQQALPQLFSSLLNAQQFGNAAFGGSMGTPQNIFGNAAYSDKGLNISGVDNGGSAGNGTGVPAPGSTGTTLPLPPGGTGWTSIPGVGHPYVPPLSQGGLAQNPNLGQDSSLVSGGNLTSPGVGNGATGYTPQTLQQLQSLNPNIDLSGYQYGPGIGLFSPQAQQAFTQQYPNATPPWIQSGSGVNLTSPNNTSRYVVNGITYEVPVGSPEATQLQNGTVPDGLTGVNNNPNGQLPGIDYSGLTGGGVATGGPGSGTLNGYNNQPGSNGLVAPTASLSQNQSGLNPEIMMQFQSLFQSPQSQSLNGIPGLSQSIQSSLGNNGTNVLNQLGTINPQTQDFQAIQQILGQKQALDLANTRERFTGTGNTQGTGASYAEAQTKAQQLPELANALQQVSTSEFQNQLGQQGNQLQALLGGQQNNTNYLSTLLGANNTQQGLQYQNQQANASNQLGTNQLNSNNLLSLLGLQNTNQAQNQQNNQFNAQQQNTLSQLIASLNQQSVQQQLQNQFTGNQNLLSTIAGLAGAGIPGGSTNVSIGNSGQSGGLGSTLGGLGALLGAIGGL